MGQYLAIDLGAESGRAILGGLSDGKLSVEELHRFPNTPLREADGLYWDAAKLWQEIQRGIEIGVGPGASTSLSSATTTNCSKTPAIIATRATTA
jgi:hypothetical protein